MNPELKQLQSERARINAKIKWSMPKYKSKAYRDKHGKAMRKGRALAKVKRFEA